MKNIITMMLCIICFATVAYGQEPEHTIAENTHFLNHNMDYELRAYFSIGGSTPLGFPRSIRKIKKYNPTLQLGLEANATKWLSDEKDWGIRLGLSVEGKGMKTNARVKNYLTEIIQDQSKVSGYYTGLVQTNVKNTYFTIPVSAVYSLSSKWNLDAGFYISFLIDQQFNGYVSDGYLRQGTPVGAKISFENGSKAAYDFSDNERTFQWGAQIGSEYTISHHLKAIGVLRYGINNLFEKDFHSISFGMHNVYLNLGFGYEF